MSESMNLSYELPKIPKKYSQHCIKKQIEHDRMVKSIKACVNRFIGRQNKIKEKFDHSDKTILHNNTSIK